jgi:hypothetical protein
MSDLDNDHRRRRGAAEGEAEYEPSERGLAEGSVITVPTITLEGERNGASDAQQATVDVDGAT